MKANEIKKVTIVGAGTMGSQIALQCAISGLDVVLYDIHEHKLQFAPLVMRYLWGMIGKTDGDELDRLLSKIQHTTDINEAGKDCDLLSESVPEDPELKAKVFAEFHQVCPERTIFTTNTSSLLPSMFAKESGRPEKLLALHFHMPLLAPNVVDVMPHEGTDPEVVQTVQEFARTIEQIPMVPQKESSGYIFNYMLAALLDAAIDLVINGVGTIEQVDRSWMGVFKMPIGPFGLMDQIGLQTVYTINNYWAEKDNDDIRRKRVAFIKTYVDKGHIGLASGRGFFAYPNPEYQKSSFVVGTETKEALATQG